MVTESSEKTEEENRSGRESTASSTKEIPRWNAAMNISCTRFHELFCCQRITHSVLFYIVLFLFLLIFIYILRKLVSFPGGDSKYNSRKPNNNTGIPVRNHSSKSFEKGRPTEWPKIDKIVDDLAPNFLSATRKTPVNEKKSNIYGWSGFVTENPTTDIAPTPYNNHQESGIAYPEIKPATPKVNENDIYKSLLQSKLPEKPPLAQGNTADASGSLLRDASQWSSWDRYDNEGFIKSRQGPENSGYGNAYGEWSPWNFPGYTGAEGSSSNYFSSAASKKTPYRYPSWNIHDYSGSSFQGGSNTKLFQNRVSEFQDGTITPKTNGKITFKSSSGFSRDSSWPSGSGFGWYRFGDQDSSNSYSSSSSYPRNRFYFDEASGKWAYSNNNAYNYPYKYKPTVRIYNNVNSGYTNYDNTIDGNSWNPDYSYERVNQTDDWRNFNSPSDRLAVIPVASNYANSGRFGTSTTVSNDKLENEQDHSPAKVTVEGKDEGIHRWPLDGRLTEESDDKSSSQFQNAVWNLGTPGISIRHKHVRPSNNKAQHSSKKKPRSGKRKIKKEIKTKNRHTLHLLRSQRRKKRLRKPIATTFFKKSRIPHLAVQKKKTNRHQKKRRKVKSKAKSTLRSKLNSKKPQLSLKVSHPKRHFNTQRKKKMSTFRHKSKTLHQPFSSYASYTNFVKRHQISNVLVGKWHHKIHHVKKCKTLSQFKAQGKVQLSRKYLRHRHQYRYTVLSCRYFDSGDDEDDDSESLDDQSPTSGDKICREFWYITSGRIILRKLTGNHGKNVYALMLCKNKGSAEGRKGTPSKNVYVDNNNNDNESQNRKDNNDNDNNDDDDDDDDDDQDLDSDNIGESKRVDGETRNDDIANDSANAKKKTGKKHSNNVEHDDKTESDSKTWEHGGKNDEDFDDDNDDDDNNDDEPLDDNESTHVRDDHDNDSTGSDRQETSSDHKSNQNLPDSDDDDDDYVDTDDIPDQHRTHKKTPRKTKYRKTSAKKTQNGVKKSFIPKHSHKHFIKRIGIKVPAKGKHKTALSNGDSDNNSMYTHLLEALEKNDDTKNTKSALARVLGIFYKKKTTLDTVTKRHKSKKSRKFSHNKNIFHKRKNPRKLTVKGNKKLFKKMFEGKDVTDLRTFLKNLLTNPKNLQSSSQITRNQSTSKKKEPSKEPTKLDTTNHPSHQSDMKADMKGVLKELLPDILQGTTKLATNIPSPTPTPPPPPKRTTPVPGHNNQILNLLRKLGVEVKHNPVTTSSPESNSKSTLEPRIPSELNPSQEQELSQQNTSDTSTSNTNQQPVEQTVSFDNSLRSYIPKAKSSQPQSFSTVAAVPRPSAFPPTYVNPLNNHVAAPPSRQAGNGYYGYPTYLSRGRNPYLYQTPSTNILCFGDSLTSGFYNHGRGKHPYSIRLNQILNADGKHRYNIVTRGVVGEMVHGRMTKRLPKVLNEGTHFDWILILGGSNDVAHVKNFGDDEEFTQQLISVWSPKIVKDIEKLHETARRYGARTLLMTIPETAYELWPEFRSIRNMRLSVNAALRKYATQVRDTTVLCDLAIKLPRSSLSQELQKLYWNDHIHLNPVGYNKMADIIGKCIQPYLTY